jgi:penicillin-binding protein 1C
MVRARTALACSYNIATVQLVQKYGIEMLLSKLHEAGFSSLTRDAAYYGPGLALGCGEVTLLELVRAYGGIANGGVLRDLRLLETEPVREQRRFFSRQTAYLLTDILSDNTARAPAFGEFSPISLTFKCAAKTGTSKNFRDNWTAGYTPRYTVAVWVGNFDGKPMYSVSGISGAGPIFRDVMLALEIRNPDRDFALPGGMLRRAVCAVSGELPTQYCSATVNELFIKGSLPSTHCTMHRPVAIDTRNGLLAASDCPQEFREEKTYTVYPSQYYEWALHAGVEMPPAEISQLPGTGMYSAGARSCSIELPKNGDIFKLDPVLRQQYQEIPLKPVVAENVARVVWHIDATEIVADKYPFIVYWKLVPGRHVISYTATVNGSSLKSNAVTITVMK